MVVIVGERLKENEGGVQLCKRWPTNLMKVLWFRGEVI